MAVELSDARELHGVAVVGRNDEKLGKVEMVFLDNETRHPEWAAVKTGLFGAHVSLVPLAVAEYREGSLVLPYDKDAVQRAPHHDPDQSLSIEQERELFEHYGLDHGGETATTGRREDRAVGHDVSGPNTDEAMTRSEEEMRVRTQTQERGRARLRKYVVTEEQTTTVPVSHEEVVVEREPITETNAPAAHDGPAISEEEHEVVLHEERPVVGKETVPKERVRMGTETRRDEEQVSEQVRKEHIDAETGPDAGGPHTRDR